MADDLSFQALAQSYGLMPEEIADHGQGDRQYYASSNDGHAQYFGGPNDQHAQYYGGANGYGAQGGMNWMPPPQFVPHYMPMQPPPPTEEPAAMADHFDYERAEAAGLVVAANHFRTTAPAHALASLRVPARSTYPNERVNESDEEQRRYTSRIQQAQPENDVYAEPEPGRRVKLVSVKSLRE